MARAQPPAKSTGKRQPTGTTHFQLRPNQFGRGIGGGVAAGSIIQTKAIDGSRKSEREATIIPERPKLFTYHGSLFTFSPRQRLLGICQGVRGDGDNGGILLLFARNDFIKRIG